MLHRDAALQCLFLFAADLVSQKSFQAIMIVIAFLLVMLDRSLMVYQVRTALGIEPRYAILVGASAGVMAIYLIVKSSGHNGG